jgi:NADPH:quinone reductase-like Zn-dependent oxidoreductase
MKAAIINSFGGSNVFKVENNFPIPEPKKNQVLVRVMETSVNPLDWKTRNGELKSVLGSKFPMILGNDISGVVLKCGEKVTNFKEGDNVYGMADTNVKPSWFGFATTGAYAEFICTREDTLTLKPDNISFEEAASIPLCGLTVYQALVKKLKIKKDDKILINGASGGVGVIAVQISKALGAKVTAIAAGRNKELLFELGADYFYDYQKTSIIEIDKKFDIIYDVVANSSYKETKHLLSNTGVYLSNIPNPIAAIIPCLRNSKRIKKKTFAWVSPSGADLSKISQMIESEEVKAVIDKIYPLNEIKKAHEHSERGKVTGKISIRISDENTAHNNV